MEAQTTVSNSTQCGLFIVEYKKYTVSGVAFSFNWCKHFDIRSILSVAKTMAS